MKLRTKFLFFFGCFIKTKKNTGWGEYFLFFNLNIRKSFLEYCRVFFFISDISDPMGIIRKIMIKLFLIKAI